MEKKQNQELKWEGKVRAKLTGSTADEAWSLLKDFCSLHKWIPPIDTCYKVEGVDGQLGCVRYCAGSINRSDNNQTIGWSKERLIAFDPIERTYSYEIVETNKGFGRYEATIKVVPDPDGDCSLEWSIDADPVKGWTRDGFVSYLEKLAQAIAGRVVEALQIGK